MNRALSWLWPELARLQPLIPTYIHLLASALIPIYAGSHSSLSRPSSAAEKQKRVRGNDETQDDDELEDEDREMEGLSTTDAILFPIIAGVTLCGLYLIIKWMQDLELLNKILNWYFAVFSVFSVAALISDGLDLIHSMMFPFVYRDKDTIFHVKEGTRLATSMTPSASSRKSPLPGYFSRITLPDRALDIAWTLRLLARQRIQVKIYIKSVCEGRIRLGIHNIEGFCVAIASVLWYNFMGKPWWLTNLMGFGFAYGALQLLSPTTFLTATLVLSGLFFYDIYFVFFTPIMVTVAQSLDIPIKLLFPRPASPEADPKSQSLSMLGLGDIVLPGIVIGLALRFDLYLHYLRKQEKVAKAQTTHTAADAVLGDIDKDKDKESKSTLPFEKDASIKAPYVSVANAWGDRFWSFKLLHYRSRTEPYIARNAFPKPYFHAGMSGYCIGMIATLCAMQLSNHPQPALLYLAPSVLMSLWATAYAKGEVATMWSFSDSPEVKAEAKQVVVEEKTDAKFRLDDAFEAGSRQVTDCKSSQEDVSDKVQSTQHGCSKSSEPTTETNIGQYKLVELIVSLLPVRQRQSY